MGTLVLIFIIVLGVTVAAPKIGIPILGCVNLIWAIWLISEYGAHSFAMGFWSVVGICVSAVAIACSAKSF